MTAIDDTTTPGEQRLIDAIACHGALPEADAALVARYYIDQQIARVTPRTGRSFIIQDRAYLSAAAIQQALEEADDG